MNDLKKQVAELIREARKAKGLTQKELGVKLGSDEQRVSKFENGQINPTVGTLQKVFDTLGVSVTLTLNK